ncbi:phosphotransferase [Nonomuraea sp. SMC257]|uniref:Phosphotransferase n=1 Tax=Nonomuraea montanisoli TaxID=2741721 RepID=A0A7Y6IAR9_9ACTN|nr:phosphotransferase [Nonomuraea montanisoli]NUW34798.1 phosphotransferase [Nonomuraea montanisoli]
MGTTTRRSWKELPAGLRREVARRLGGEIRGFGDRPGGFSYGVLGVAEFGEGAGENGGGQVFVKAVPSEDGDGYREEAVVARALPVTVPSPRLRFAVERDGWVLLCFGVAPGRPPHEPWLRHELDAALDALTLCVRELTPSPLTELPTVAGRMAGRCETWRSLEAAGVTGDTLLHFDLRHDNVLVAPDGVARVVDWGRACLGPGWVDLVCLLLLSRADGVDLEETFLAHPLGRGAPPGAVDAFLVALADYWTRTAALPGPAHAPHLRDRRERSRAATIGWLRRRWGTRGARPSGAGASKRGRSS